MNSRLIQNGFKYEQVAMKEKCFFLFSVHISYGKGKHLNQTVFLQNMPRIKVIS